MLRFAGGQYDVTADDRLWLLRAVAAEGPPSEMVARTLVNGFARARGERAFRGSLEDWVRSYAQPVNPRWYVTGDKFRAQLAAAPAEERATLTRLARNRETVHSQRSTFAAGIEQAVDQALTTPFASDVTDYAAPTLDASQKGYIARSIPRQGENAFWTRAAGWTGYIATGRDGGGPMVALALIAAAWLLLRGRA